MIQPASETRQARPSALIWSYFLVSFRLLFSLPPFRSKRSANAGVLRRRDELGESFLGRAAGTGNRGGSLGNGQPAGYPRARPRGGCDDDISPVQLDEALDKGETETGSRLPDPAF